MDLIVIIALVLFIGMIVSWLVLPGVTATGVPAETAEKVAKPAAKQPV